MREVQAKITFVALNSRLNLLACQEQKIEIFNNSKIIKAIN